MECAQRNPKRVYTHEGQDQALPNENQILDFGGQASHFENQASQFENQAFSLKWALRGRHLLRPLHLLAQDLPPFIWRTGRRGSDVAPGTAHAHSASMLPQPCF